MVSRTGSRVILLGGLVLVGGVSTIAQVAPAFDVASVRKSEAPTGMGAIADRARTLPGGRYQGTSTLRTLIYAAWDLQPYQRVEGSFKILDDWFTVAAKATADAPIPAPGEPGPYNRMLRGLLIERFKLQVQFKEEMQPAMILRRVSADKLGPGLRPSSVTCPTGAQPAPGAERVLWQRCHSGVINGAYDGAVPSMGAFATFVSLLLKATGGVTRKIQNRGALVCSPHGRPGLPS